MNESARCEMIRNTVTLSDEEQVNFENRGGELSPIVVSLPSLTLPNVKSVQYGKKLKGSGFN